MRDALFGERVRNALAGALSSARFAKRHRVCGLLRASCGVCGRVRQIRARRDAGVRRRVGGRRRSGSARMGRGTRPPRRPSRRGAMASQPGSHVMLCRGRIDPSRPRQTRGGAPGRGAVRMRRSAARIPSARRERCRRAGDAADHSARGMTSKRVVRTMDCCVGVSFGPASQHAGCPGRSRPRALSFVPSPPAHPPRLSSPPSPSAVEKKIRVPAGGEGEAGGDGLRTAPKCACVPSMRPNSGVANAAIAPSRDVGLPASAGPPRGCRLCG